MLLPSRIACIVTVLICTMVLNASQPLLESSWLTTLASRFGLVGHIRYTKSLHNPGTIYNSDTRLVFIEVFFIMYYTITSLSLRLITHITYSFILYFLMFLDLDFSYSIDYMTFLVRITGEESFCCAQVFLHSKLHICLTSLDSVLLDALYFIAANVSSDQYSTV